MKNLNLIEWLSRNSHEKQSPQRFGRYAAMLLMLLTLGVGQMWADAHMYLIGDATGNWSTNKTNYPVNKNYGQSEKYCIYVWMETNQCFALWNGSSQFGPSSNKDDIKDGTGGGVGAYNSNAWEYTGATGLVRVCVDQNQSDSWKPYVWVEEMKTILNGTDAMFYYGDTWGSGTKYVYPYTGTTALASGNSFATQSSTNITYCKIGASYAANQNPYISNNSSATSWRGVQMSDVVGGALYSLTNDGGNKINKTNPPSFTWTTSSNTISQGTAASGLAATCGNSKYNNLTNTVYYYYTTDNSTFTGFNPTDVSDLAAGTYTIWALACDGFIAIRSNTSGTLTITEPTYTVTINDGDHGTVSPHGNQSAGETGGVDITATPSKGYLFDNWTKTGGAVLSSTTTNPTTVTATATGTVTAHYKTKYRIVGGDSGSADGADAMGNWNDAANQIANIGTNASSKDTGYVNITLPANADFYFKVKDISGGGTWYGNNGNMIYTNHTNWTMSTSEGNCHIKTAGAGTYKFAWNFTENKLTVYYPTSYTVTFGYGTGGSSVTASVSGSGAGAITSGQYAAAGSNVTFSHTPASGYQLKGWYDASSGGSAVSGMSKTDNVLDAIAGNARVYAQYNPITYTGGRLDKKEGATDGSYSVTYYTTSFASKTAPTRTGYNVEGYYKETGRTTKIADASGNLQKSTTYTDASNRWTYTSSIPDLFTKWQAKTYTAANNLDKGEGDTDGQFTATYDATSIAINTAPLKEGYHVDGYYKEAGLTNLIASSAGVLEASTAYTDASRHWTNDGNVTLHTKWAPTVYTISFDADDTGRPGTATNVQGNVTVTFDDNNYSAATVKVPVLAGYTFGGYYTAVDGGGVQIVDEEGAWIVPGSGEGNSYLDDSGNWVKAANTTVYAKWTANNYTVNFDCNNGSGTIYHYTIAMGATYGSGTADLPLAGELPTPSKFGYHFVGWYTLPTGGTEVTKDTQMATASEHTIYAHYEEVTYVYFCNNLGWANVYVTYDAYWDTYEDKGSGNNGKIYHQMTLVDGTTNIYRDEVPASILASWKGDICFGDTKQGTLGDNGGYNNFNLGKNIFRRDFDSYATMFVPEKAASKDYTKNSGADYYCSNPWTDGDPVTDYRYEHGYWMKYNSSDYRSGYAGYVIKGSWDGEQNDYYFKRDGATSNDYTVTKYMEAGQTYNFRIYKHCTTTNTYSSWFTYNRGGSAITSAACTNLELSANIAKTETSIKDKFTSTIAGDYTFKLTCDPNGTLKLSIVYPERTDDYFRVVYTWNDGSNHTRIYKTFKRIANGGDAWFEAFVHKAASPIVSRSMKLQRYNGSSWGDVAGQTFDLSGCTKNGLYSFTMTRSSQDVITLRYVGPYTGTIYLRSDVTAGGWDYYNYASYGNSVMTYSDFSKRQAQNPYSHYYCVYVDNDKTNVAFTIATSNTPSICDTLVGDATIGNAALATPNYKALPASNPANIRFMYNDSLNTISRAYLKSAQGDDVNKRFLVLHGDSKMFNPNGTAIAANASRELAANELEFTDKGNWVYEISLKAAPIARAKVIARYNGTTSAADRYLIGGSGDTDADWKTILGGTVSGTQYALAGTYDFKTNRLMLAWTPDGEEITAAISDVDMLWVRHAGEAATQIKFGVGGSLTNISVVGAIQFRYEDLVGRVGSWNAETRPYLKYFVSFPFDVSVSNIFGLNEAEYGREYVIQKYNGAKRAEDGYFIADGSNFWENLTIDSVMHANEGYCVIMDNDYLNNVTGYGNIWKNKTAGSSVYLYFPANDKMSITGSNGKTTAAASHQSTRDKSYTSGGHSYNMKETDSHWNLVGAPYFSNAAVTAGPSAYYKWDTDNTWKPWLFNGEKTAEYEGVSNNFNAMSCFMVQYQGTITWSAVAPPALSAPRRTLEDEKSNIVALQLLQEEEQVDRAFIELKEGAGTGFVLCEDMIKIFNNGKPNLYVHASEYATSYSQVPVESQTVSVGVDIYNSGVYTFSMPSNFNGTAILVDKYEQTRTNLSLENYEVSLDPGVIKDRFEVEINVGKMPTAIDGAEDGSGSLKDGKAHKFIMNGVMYILNDGVLYDARGNRVK